MPTGRAYALEKTETTLMSDEVREALRRLDIIHRCATGKLDEPVGYPCPLAEMTERERQIAHVASVYGGALQAIRDWSDLGYPVNQPDEVREAIDIAEAVRRLRPGMVLRPKTADWQWRVTDDRPLWRAIVWAETLPELARLMLADERFAPPVTEAFLAAADVEAETPITAGFGVLMQPGWEVEGR